MGLVKGDSDAIASSTNSWGRPCASWPGKARRRVEKRAYCYRASTSDSLKRAAILGTQDMSARREDCLFCGAFFERPGIGDDSISGAASTRRSIEVASHCTCDCRLHPSLDFRQYQIQRPDALSRQSRNLCMDCCCLFVRCLHASPIHPR